jgi:hypothetical protein
MEVRARALVEALVRSTAAHAAYLVTGTDLNNPDSA